MSNFNFHHTSKPLLTSIIEALRHQPRTIMTSRQYIKLAESLPPRLSRFFARYPPPALQGVSSPPSSSIEPNSSTPSANTNGVDQITEGVSKLSTSTSEPNPFQPHRHPVTGRWQDPTFSLRRQAELVKLARQHGVEELLPFTVKGTAERVRRRAENGLRVKGTGVGQKVKGKEAERTMRARYVNTFIMDCYFGRGGCCIQSEGFMFWELGVTNCANPIACDRLEKRRQAMLEMPKMIQEWKQVRCFSRILQDQKSSAY
jgi:large subunit ribosomal protein L25